jgi:hypothetical protein
VGADRNDPAWASTQGVIKANPLPIRPQFVNLGVGHPQRLYRVLDRDFAVRLLVEQIADLMYELARSRTMHAIRIGDIV